MTKTVRLTQKYIRIIKFLKSRGAKTITGDLFSMYDGTNLAVDNTAYDHKDIARDSSSVPLYDLRTDAAGRLTKDLNSINRTVSVDLYTIEDENDTTVMPNEIVDRFVGIVEEVT